MWVFIVLAVVAGVLSIWWHMSRSDEILEHWAAENRLRLLEVERRFLRRGPFWWRAGEGHEVFRVTVADASGRTRSGYVRVGGWLTGLFSRHAVAEWDDERA